MKIHNDNEGMKQDAASSAQKILKRQLDASVQRFKCESFISVDPICVPYQYTSKADIEIAAFIAATFAWGQRPTIINKTRELLGLMDDSPHDFIRDHTPAQRRRFDRFVHRTFQPTDARYFMRRLQEHYRQHDSLEAMFVEGFSSKEEHVGPALVNFHDRFFALPKAPARTRKHVATPARNSSCKRLNMFLRWMVRPASSGVDFGLWRGIRTDQLLIPLDVHVQRVAQQLGLLSRKQADWKAVLELTSRLRSFDPTDPVKYDFALFGQGVLDKYGELPGD